jgi:hypothetical protein
MSAREWLVPLPWLKPPLTANEQRRMHYQAEARIKRHIRWDVGFAAVAAYVPRGLQRVEIVLNWQPAIARRRDEDALAPTLKSVVDGLAAGTKRYPGHGLVPDDTPDHVTSRTVIHPVAKPARFWLTIREVTE